MSEAIHFIGLMHSPVSWAKVGRELVAALAKEAALVSAVSLKGYMYDEAFPLAPEVERAIAAKRVEGWDLALDYPPNFQRLTGKRRAGILIYEGSALPCRWAEAVRRYLDRAFVPSRFCLEAAVAAGVPREMLAVAPFGVNSEAYRPRRPALADKPPVAHRHTGRSFNFLTVGAPHVRKGLAETVEAFCGAFGPREDVGLVVKCPPIAQLGRRPWEYRRIEDCLPDNRGGQIALVTEVLGEPEMAELYRGADVYVQASYGEGFGLALVEAAACGRPAITTGWGAAAEVFDATSAWMVDYDVVDASSFAYDWSTGDGEVMMARPRVAGLAEAMRRAFESQEEREAKAAAALETAREMTWARGAEAITRQLEV